MLLLNNYYLRVTFYAHLQGSQNFAESKKVEPAGR